MPQIVRYQLAGRLGNQLFQWAFAHRVALESSRQVQFTVDRFHHPKGLAEYQLSNLQCSHIVIPRKFDLFGAVLVIIDKMGEKGSALVPLLRNRLYRESINDPFLERLSKKSTFVTGFFIHKSNVEKYKSTISSEFCTAVNDIFKMNWADKLPEKYEAVHIRKGDFKFHQDTYGILSNQYYLNAIQNKLPLVVVTDFREESSELIRMLAPFQIYDSSNSTAWDALAIMSHAEILHISNSTLSWWGGFGASEIGKKVFMPSPFYKSLNAEDSNNIFKLDRFQTSPSNFI